MKLETTILPATIQLLSSFIPFSFDFNWALLASSNGNKMNQRGLCLKKHLGLGNRYIYLVSANTRTSTLASSYVKIIAADNSVAVANRSFQ